MPSDTPISAPRAVWLLMRIQALRVLGQMTAGFRRFGRKKKAVKRTATAGKRRGSWLIGGFIALSMAFTFTNIAYQSFKNISEIAGTAVFHPGPKNSINQPKQKVANKQQAAPEVRLPLVPAPGFTLPSNVLTAISFQALIILLAVTLLSVGNGELVQQDWDLEWLVTLPVRLSTLLGTRIVVRALVNPLALYALLPFLSIIAWDAGYGAASPLLGIAALAPLLFIAATLQTLAETGSRLRLGPSQLRNLQALISVAAVLTFFLAMSPGMPAKISFVADWALALPSWTAWLPPALAVKTVTSTAPAAALQYFGLLVVEAIAFVLLGLTLLRSQLRLGIVASGARESTRRVKKVAPAQAADSSRRSILTPIQWREICLLGRDRNFLVQTLVMPIVLVGAQLFFNNSAGGALFSSPASHPELLASIAFGIAAYSLMFSAFQTLNTEGQALWILYTVPHSLQSILRQKAVLWSIASLVYPVAVFGFAFTLSGTLSPKALLLTGLVLAGVPIFAVIATALGVFACDPLAPAVQRRVKISYTYLYALIASTYIYSIYATTIWQRLALLVLSALLAIALWQKARDQLPYLLDPTASPPARVSVSDGLIAALLFFVLQGVVTLLRVDKLEKLSGFDVLVAFTIAGAVTYALMRLAFWRSKSEGIPRTFGPGTFKAAALGAAGGIAAAGAAFLYLRFALPALDFENMQQAVLFGRRDAWLLVLLAVIAAPLFEEFIFRGLIFGGLKRSMGIGASTLASAAIFAIVHPPASIIPVFGLGIVTALVYQRSRLLVGPMVAHAVYNGFVVGLQFIS